MYAIRSYYESWKKCKSRNRLRKGAIDLQENIEIRTGQEVKAPSVQHGVSHDAITTKTETGKLRNIHGIKSKRKYSRKTVFRAIGIKELRLKNRNNFV